MTVRDHSGTMGRVVGRLVITAGNLAFERLVADDGAEGNLAKVLASLDVVCTKCGGLIAPAQIRRIDFERIECPVCGERFAPSRN